MNKGWVFLFVILFAVGVSLLIPGVQREIVKLSTTVTGTLRVTGVAPQVLYVYVCNSSGLDCGMAGDPGDDVHKPAFSPPPDNYGTLVFKATVYDSNADCAAATFYICDNNTNPGSCNAGASGVVSLTDSTPDKYTCNVEGFDCTNCCCNYTVTWSEFPYYKKCGSWYVNVTGTDDTSLSNSTVKWWKDAMTEHLYYPWVSQGNAGSIINLGPVNAGQWNNATGENWTKNGGNVPLSLKWNASDFVGYDNAAGYSIPIDLCSNIPSCSGGETNLGIDDTPDWPPCGWINETPTVQTSYPGYGAQRCTSFDCNLAADSQAKYSLYYHIFVPGGQRSGPYNNTLEVEFHYTETCD